MGENTKIEWATHTFNPWTGCTKVSPACANCYAEARALRFKQGAYKKGVPRIRTSPANWRKPIAWNKAAAKVIADSVHDFSETERFTPKRPRVFCASLGDWLDDEVQIKWLVDLLQLIHDTPNLDWLLLSKRPQNWRPRLMAARLFHCNTAVLPGGGWSSSSAGFLASWLADWLSGIHPQNVWIGTTVEDQQRANERIPHLLRIPAKVRFLSCEPLLGPVNLYQATRTVVSTSKLPLDWTIAGGESGPGARPSHPGWFRNIRQQCTDSKVPFFFKQWGDIMEGRRVGKAAAGRLLDGREWNEVPS